MAMNTQISSLTPRHLHQILTIAQFGTFNSAAKALNLSQPALTTSINKLEAQLGVPLFLRGKRGVEPTVFGQHMIDNAPDILSRLAIVQDELRLLAGSERGELRIAGGPVIVQGALSEIIPVFCRQFPGIELSIHTIHAPQIPGEISRGLVDLGLGTLFAEDEDSDLIQLPLLSEPLSFVTRPDHPLQQQEMISVGEMFAFPMAVPEVPADLQQCLDDMGTGFGMAPRSAVISDHYGLLYGVVRETDMVTGGPSHLLRSQIEQGHLKPLKIRETLPEWRAFAAYRQVSTLSPTFMALLNMVEAWFKKQAR